MTKDAKQAWGEVGDKFTSWGRRVADRYHAAGSAEATAADDAEREMKHAAKELIEELSRGIFCIGGHVPRRSGETGSDRCRQRDRGCHHRHGERGDGGDPLEGWVIHAAPSAAAPACRGLTRCRSPTASTG